MSSKLDLSLTQALNRREFLNTAVGTLCTAAVTRFNSSQDPETRAGKLRVVVIEPNPKRAALNFLSWDTEHGDRASVNLLRSPIYVRVTAQGQSYSSLDIDVTPDIRGNWIEYQIPIQPQCRLRWTIDQETPTLVMTLSAVGDAISQIEAVEMVYPWAPRVTPTTILPKRWTLAGALMPIVVTAPDFGQILVNSSLTETQATLFGSRSDITADLVLTFPSIEENRTCILEFSPLHLLEPRGLKDLDLWRSVRRTWFNAWQPSTQWGDQTVAQSSPGGVLANNTISDPVSFSLVFYADQALWTPSVTSEISIMESVRHTLEWWLDSRTDRNGQVVGYWDYSTFLDSNPSILISAWDYVEATNDLTWLRSRMPQLERIAECLHSRDLDDDGLYEATQSGNFGTLVQPQRSSNWYDGINFGYKDAYCNALIYRAWCCMADLQVRLGRRQSESQFKNLAGRLRATYRTNLWNPENKWLACWKSEDGVLHDYASPVVNGMAIEYGLLSNSEGQSVLNRLWDKISQVGFTRFDLGIPSVLCPVVADDYIQPDGFGTPKLPDGTDTFQQYENGGITAGQTIHFLAAHYVVGIPDRADEVLQAMIRHQASVGFQNGVRDDFPAGLDWTTWNGTPCGYEGYLADVYAFLPAVLLRQSEFRDRYYGPLRSQL